MHIGLPCELACGAVAKVCADRCTAAKFRTRRCRVLVFDLHLPAARRPQPLFRCTHQRRAHAGPLGSDVDNHEAPMSATRACPGRLDCRGAAAQQRALLRPREVQHAVRPRPCVAHGEALAGLGLGEAAVPVRAVDHVGDAPRKRLVLGHHARGADDDTDSCRRRRSAAGGGGVDRRGRRSLDAASGAQCWLQPSRRRRSAGGGGVDRRGRRSLRYWRVSGGRSRCHRRGRRSLVDTSGVVSHIFALSLSSCVRFHRSALT